MKIKELRESLKDLAEGSNDDHPCNIAIKIIDDAYTAHFGGEKYEDFETDEI